MWIESREISSATVTESSLKFTTKTMKMVSAVVTTRSQISAMVSSVIFSYILIAANSLTVTANSTVLLWPFTNSTLATTGVAEADTTESWSSVAPLLPALDIAKNSNLEFMEQNERTNEVNTPMIEEINIQMSAVVTPALIALGIVGNAFLSLVFLLTPLRLRPLSHTLAGLGVVDLMYTVGCMLVYLTTRGVQVYSLPGTCQFTTFLLTFSKGIQSWYIFVCHINRLDAHTNSGYKSRTRRVYDTKFAIVLIALLVAAPVVSMLWSMETVSFASSAYCVPMRETVHIHLIIKKVEMLVTVFLPLTLIAGVDLMLILKLVVYAMFKEDDDDDEELIGYNDRGYHNSSFATDKIIQMSQERPETANKNVFGGSHEDSLSVSRSKCLQMHEVSAYCHAVSKKDSVHSIVGNVPTDDKSGECDLNNDVNLRTSANNLSKILADDSAAASEPKSCNIFINEEIVGSLSEIFEESSSVLVSSSSSQGFTENLSGLSNLSLVSTNITSIPSESLDTEIVCNVYESHVSDTVSESGSSFTSVTSNSLSEDSSPNSNTEKPSTIFDTPEIFTSESSHFETISGTFSNDSLPNRKSSAEDSSSVEFINETQSVSSQYSGQTPGSNLPTVDKSCQVLNKENEDFMPPCEKTIKENSDIRKLPQLLSGSAGQINDEFENSDQKSPSDFSVSEQHEDKHFPDLTLPHSTKINLLTAGPEPVTNTNTPAPLNVLCQVSINAPVRDSVSHNGSSSQPQACNMKGESENPLYHDSLSDSNVENPTSEESSQGLSRTSKISKSDSLNSCSSVRDETKNLKNTESRKISTSKNSSSDTSNGGKVYRKVGLVLSSLQIPKFIRKNNKMQVSFRVGKSNSENSSKSIESKDNSKDSMGNSYVCNSASMYSQWRSYDYTSHASNVSRSDVIPEDHDFPADVTACTMTVMLMGLFYAITVLPSSFTQTSKLFFDSPSTHPSPYTMQLSILLESLVKINVSYKFLMYIFTLPSFRYAIVWLLTLWVPSKLSRKSSLCSQDVLSDNNEVEHV